MKELTCEMCGSNNVVKQDGLFVRQVCNTKYSKEEAKKIIFEDTVKIEGSVKIDFSEDLKNLYNLARRSRNNGNYYEMYDYYNQILLKESNSWEAIFYTSCFNFLNTYSKFDVNSLNQLSNNILNALVSIKDNNYDLEKQDSIISDFSSSIFYIFKDITNLIFKHYIARWGYIPTNDKSYPYFEEKLLLKNIFYITGDYLIELFGIKYSTFAVELWKKGILEHTLIYDKLYSDDRESEKLNEYISKVYKYNPSYSPPLKIEKKGCYIATSIYGSYNCPEVWTLRRYRDYKLRKTIHGQIFIKIYYTISPTIVKYFGKTKIFKKLIKPRLDKFVTKLQNKGYSSKYYTDK